MNQKLYITIAHTHTHTHIHVHTNYSCNRYIIVLVHFAKKKV